MERIIRSVKKNELEATLTFVERVFTEWENPEEGKLVRGLVEEIREKKYYVPELDLVMVDENDSIMGMALFSRFHIEGRYEDKMLILTPVAVKTELQRQHISRDIIEYGFERARELGFKFCMVEGNPMNYRSRGFVRSADHGVFADESIGLPHVDCLMIREIVPGGLDGVHGYLNYKFYNCLT